MTEAPPTAITTAISRLSDMRDQLLAAKKARELGPDGAEALAECNFRIALDAETDVVEAVALLRESVRLDGANPKYAYHLARIHFAHGDFDTAATWLQTAVRLCPTSHRLWVHVGLLQRELNTRFYGDDRYEPHALRARAEQVETGIADGADGFDPALLSFTPPASGKVLQEQNRQGGRAAADPRANGAVQAFSTVKRLTRANACRWSGIHDLRVEHLLQAEPTKRGLGRLLPLLTRAAEASPQRRGGPSGFCILGVLWMVAGYPVATVRRLIPVACPHSGPARELLEAVCGLYEASPAELPARLAAVLTAGTLPPLLAAVVHRRRVLNRPFEFRAMTTLRAARRIVSDARLGTLSATADKDATDLSRRLISAVEALYPPPPEELKDEPPAAKAATRDAATLTAAFAALQRAAVALEEVRDKAFVFLKGDLAPRVQPGADPASLALAVADRALFDELVKALKSSGELGDSQVETVVQELTKHPGAAPPDFQNERDECQKKFRGVQSLGNFEKVFRRMDGPLAAAREAATGAVPPTPALAELLAAVRSALPTTTEDPTAGQGTDPAAAGTALGQQADAMAATLDTDWGRVKALVAAHKRNEPPLTPAEREEAGAIKARVEGVLARSKVLLEEVATLRGSGQVPPAAIPDLDAAEKRLLGLGERNGPFRKNFTALQLPDAPPPAPRLTVSVSAGPAPVPIALAERPTPPPADRAGVSGLTQVLSYTEREIGRAFATAEATFAPYSATDLDTDGLAALRWTVLARKAETLYRLGRRAEARRVWSRLLRLDPLDPGVRRNLAVCDTAAGEPARCLAAWQAYAEVLYFFDVVADDPRPHAQQRADLHRVIGNSYAPPAVYTKADDWKEQLDPVSVIAFLGSPGGVRNFVGHKLLEYFNTRLVAASPPVIVGIGRSDPKDLRDRASTRWEEFQERVKDDLPLRVRGAVSGVVARHVRNAVEECGQTARLAQKRDSTYGDDRKRLLELVIDFSQTRLRLGILLSKAADLAGQLAGFDGLVELLRLDDAPYDANPELFLAASGKLGYEPDELRKLFPGLAAQFVMGALKFILDDPTDEADQARRRDLFGRMVAQVVPHPTMKDAVPFIDGPYRSMQLTKKWLPDAEPATEKPVLRRWHHSFPTMAGVAFKFAQLLLQESHKAGAGAPALEFEATAALEIGAQQGFFAPSVEICIRQLISLRQGQGKVSDALALAERYRDASTNEVNRAVLSRMCLQLRFQDAMEHERFADALKIGTDMLTGDDRDFAHVQNLLKAFGLAARRTRRDPGRREVIGAVTAWVNRAQARWDRLGDAIDEDAVTPATIAQVKALRDETLIQAVVAEHTESDGSSEARPLADGLTVLLAEYPDLPGAYFQRMLAWDQLADDADTDEAKAEAREYSLADAAQVLTRSTNAQQKQAAADLIKEHTPEDETPPDDDA